MMRCNYIFFIFITIILCIDNPYYEPINSNNNQSIQSNNFNTYDYDILDGFIDEDNYIIGPGDVFLFNMITTNGVVNLELLVSPSGDVLIPIIGKVNIKGERLKNAYKIMKDKCRQKYEDAFVYISLIKLRKFKVLLTGDLDKAGMRTITSKNRVSDLIESLYSANYIDDLLSQHIPDLSKNIMIKKDVKLIRSDSVINVNLFDYYFYGKKTSNPILIEGDVINITNTDKITVLGEVNRQIRVKKEQFMTYNDLLNKAGGVTDLGDLNKIKFLNYRNIPTYYNNEKKRISSIESKYRSVVGESFLNAKNKSLDAMIYISDNIKLKDFLNSEISEGDILIVPQKSNYIQLIGGINNPGTYLYKKDKTVFDYILNAGNYTDQATNVYVLDVNSGSRTKVNKSFIPQSGSIIFIEESIGFKKWDRITDFISLSATIMSTLLIISNSVGQ